MSTPGRSRSRRPRANDRDGPDASADDVRQRADGRDDRASSPPCEGLSPARSALCRGRRRDRPHRRGAARRSRSSRSRRAASWTTRAPQSAQRSGGAFPARRGPGSRATPGPRGRPGGPTPCSWRAGPGRGTSKPLSRSRCRDRQAAKRRRSWSVSRIWRASSRAMSVPSGLRQVEIDREGGQRRQAGARPEHLEILRHRRGERGHHGEIGNGRRRLRVHVGHFRDHAPRDVGMPQGLEHGRLEGAVVAADRDR